MITNNLTPSVPLVTVPVIPRAMVPIQIVPTVDTVPVTTHLISTGAATLPVIVPPVVRTVVNTPHTQTILNVPIPYVTMPSTRAVATPRIPTFTTQTLEIKKTDVTIPSVVTPKIPIFPGQIPKLVKPSPSIWTDQISIGKSLNLTIQPESQTSTMFNTILIPTPVQVQRVISELVLRPWQIEWSQRAYDILTRNHGYIDTSRMGSGKTYITLWLAIQFKFRLLIICPVIMIDEWRKTAAEYGVELIDVISYQSLRSQKGHQPKHDFLYRHDNTTEGGVHQVHFFPTKPYTDLVEQGIMVVCDEIHFIKNKSDQYKACNALIQPIIAGGGRSRFGLISGTLFDKEEHAVNLLRLIGYIRAHRLYNYVRETREIVLEGMQELIDACRFIDASETDRVLSEIPITKGTMNHMCYTLFVRVIKANISGAMAAPTTITGRFDAKNGFYNIDENMEQQLQDAVNELANAVRFNERTGTTDIRADNIGAVTTALVHIENAKSLDFARIASQILATNKRSKVVISLNYTSTIDIVKVLLAFHNPVILTGKTLGKNKGIVVNQFNANPNMRVLIMNTAAGGIGISLHDTTGDSPRFMLMSPSYKLLEVTQAAGRIYRDGTISDATIRMFYGKGVGIRETNILTAMALKSQVLKGTFEDTVSRDLVLPGDYPSEIERDVL
jgi:hypothetical protein